MIVKNFVRGEFVLSIYELQLDYASMVLQY